METIQEIKNTIKTLGADIRETRKEHKNSQRTTGYGFDGKLSQLITDYRSLHIAYGLIRGKEYKNIEKYTRPGNEPDWKRIMKIIEDFGLKQIDAYDRGDK